MNEMSVLNKARIKAPYLILLGDIPDASYAKTGMGLAHWRRALVKGQLRFPGCPVDLGVPDLTIAEAAEMGVKSIVIGVAPAGGEMPSTWWQTLIEAAAKGLDVVSGLHSSLTESSELVATAKETGASLIDIRTPPANLPVGNHLKRTGKRILMVGTDCAVGKKYSALSLEKDMKAAGMAATFRATGQTGIMIAGEGIPIDAVVADFISGAASMISPDNHPDHWDVIEGQGSLFHPGFSGVSLGLLHGSQPDAIVLCHDASRTVSMEGHSLPSLQDCIDLHLAQGRLVNPDLRCVGVCVNTSGLPSEQRETYKNGLAKALDLPVVDPLIDGCLPIIDRIQTEFAEGKSC